MHPLRLIRQNPLAPLGAHQYENRLPLVRYLPGAGWPGCAGTAVLTVESSTSNASSVAARSTATTSAVSTHRRGTTGSCRHKEVTEIRTLSENWANQPSPHGGDYRQWSVIDDEFPAPADDEFTAALEMSLAESIDGAVVVLPVSAADKLERSAAKAKPAARLVVDAPAVDGVADTSPTDAQLGASIDGYSDTRGYTSELAPRPHVIVAVWRIDART